MKKSGLSKIHRHVGRIFFSSFFKFKTVHCVFSKVSRHALTEQSVYSLRCSLFPRSTCFSIKIIIQLVKYSTSRFFVGRSSIEINVRVHCNLGHCCRFRINLNVETLHHRRNALSMTIIMTITTILINCAYKYIVRNRFMTYFDVRKTIGHCVGNVHQRSERRNLLLAAATNGFLLRVYDNILI